MGLQSFKFATDFLNNLENPVIYVAKKDKTIVILFQSMMD